MAITFLIIVFGVGIGFATFFIVRNLFAPKKIARVQHLLKQNKYASAIKVGKVVVAQDPRNPEVHYLLAQAYLGDNKPELALMELKTVGQIGQFGGLVRETAFRQQIAQLFTRFNQPEEALKEYLLLIQQEPGTADHYYNAGRLFEERGKAAKAVGYFRKTLELQPGHADAHLHLGMILYQAKRYPDARGFLEKAVRLQSDHVEAHFFIGKIQKDNRDFQEALNSFERAAKSNEYRIKALVERASCFIELNSPERAIPDLERAISAAKDASSPDALWAHYHLASCYEQMRKIERAIEHWEAVYEKKPGFQDVAEKLSRYQELRQDDHVKDFLTAGQSEFRRMCEQATNALGLVTRAIEDIDHGCQIVAEESDTKWRNTRKQPRLLWYLRTTDMIDEATIRAAHEEQKKQNLTRAVIIASSTFSRLASDYAESRPIDLMDKDALQKLLVKGS